MKNSEKTSSNNNDNNVVKIILQLILQLVFSSVCMYFYFAQFGLFDPTRLQSLFMGLGFVVMLSASMIPTVVFSKLEDLDKR